MKNPGWCLPALTALGLVTALQPAPAHHANDTPLFQAGSAQGFRCSRAAVPVVFNHSSSVDFVLPSDLRSLPTRAKHPLILQTSDSQSNDDSQADDNSDDSGGVNVAFSEPCICPADWRLIQPDAQFANYFIHSKTKPPP